MGSSTSRDHFACGILDVLIVAVAIAIVVVISL
jgi:hypothetical protein